jgi:hypothetical protein
VERCVWCGTTEEVRTQHAIAICADCLAEIPQILDSAIARLKEFGLSSSLAWLQKEAEYRRISMRRLAEQVVRGEAAPE